MKANKTKIHFCLNGQAVSFDINPMTRLLDVLRNEAKLTGTKEGCGEGECGACSVFVNGELVNACIIPILQIDGAKVETIEGMTNGQTLHKVQKASFRNQSQKIGRLW